VPANIQQAEDRCHRIGQKDTVMVYHLVVDNSIDARLAKLLVEKQEIIKEAIDYKEKAV
jgi:SWI/SNF-related matrix-associated actin-dependent regulator 1 of chromatin subfamily A